MIKEDIYNDGTYIDNNKTLHIEDSEYKFSSIKLLLESVKFKENTTVKLLDVGGGAGIIGKFVCEYFIEKGISVEFYALDLSKEMLLVQEKNNPYIKKIINQNILDISEKDFDIIFMIDVIEHIPNYQDVAKKISKISKYSIYNIPLEVNLFDKLRNIYFKGQYYKEQERTIGHIHFFSYLSALNLMKKYYQPVKWFFPDQSSHILNTDSIEYRQQKANSLRALELKISKKIYKYVNFLSPFLIQGSLFVLNKKSREKI
ncbi:class I SAM-dependent methyltransferase [uncultured Arcobacter sp.]|uniref:class I SAM-dependent methyltransferase n=1 Tax=uncultured Arcobacter sp. TaxID=165434 RepID=UPI0026021FAC|nr:class I SAM-dependent methyltransferase [uncultured Arcobacter sp.]